MTLVRKKATLAPFGVGSSTLDAFDTVVISGGTGSGTAANGIVTFMQKNNCHGSFRPQVYARQGEQPSHRRPKVPPSFCETDDELFNDVFHVDAFLAFGGEFFAERPAVDALSAHPANGALKSNQRCIT